MKTLKLSNLLFVFLGLIAICLSLFVALPISSSAANEFVTNQPIEVRILDANNNALRGTPVTSFSEGSLYKYNWQDAKVFEIAFNSEAIVKAADGKLSKNENGNFMYNIKVEYVNEYTSRLTHFTDHTQYKYVNLYTDKQEISEISSLQNILLNIATLKENITDKLKTFASDAAEDGSQQVNKNQCFGWGIYRFSIEFYAQDETTINVSNSSSHFGLDPSVFDGEPSIQAKIISSQTGLINAYECKITNENIEYIDVDTLKWYVRGETIDGKKFVLTPSDMGEGYNNAIWNESYTRTGTTFIFESNNLAGKWEIYCELTPVGATESIRSNVLSVETGNRISSMDIIWWIVGGAVLLIIIVIVIIVVAKKKEKVW